MRTGWIVASLVALVACGDDTGGDGGVGGSGAGGGGTTGTGAGGGSATTGTTTTGGSSGDAAAATAYFCTTGCECNSFGLTFEECYEDCAAAQDQQRADWVGDPCAPELDAYASCLAFSAACVDGTFRQDPVACRAEQDVVSSCQASSGSTGSG